MTTVVRSGGGILLDISNRTIRLPQDCDVVVLSGLEAIKVSETTDQVIPEAIIQRARPNIYSLVEFLFTGTLRQHLDFDEHIIAPLPGCTEQNQSASNGTCRNERKSKRTREIEQGVPEQSELPQVTKVRRGVTMKK